MSTVRHTVSGSIATITLDNTAKLNALTPAMMEEMAGVLDRIEAASTVRAVLLTSAGERFFCAGADINAWAGYSPQEFARIWVRGGHRLFDRLARLAKPTIAVLHGHAFGGGLELAAACDIRVMAPQAEIALPESGVGIVPGWSGTQRLLRLLPESAVKEMALFGCRISADRALALGFAAEISADPLEAAQTFAARLASTSSTATEIAKYMIHAAAGEDAPAMIEALASGMAAASADKAEGVRAFREKRKPNFTGA
jgi:enoyl-CoA hydratase/carnithine racemase